MDRPDPPLLADERTMLRGFLDYHRGTLAKLCEGLSDDQLARRASPPSTLSLLALLRHMAEVERHWFRRVIGGQDVPHVWSDSHDFQAAYDTTGASYHEAYSAWASEVEKSRHIELAAHSLDVTGFADSWNETVSLRMVMLHMIHDYARHNGHADLLREAVDGTTGV